MPIRHRTEETRLACASKAALQRSFGAAWEMISKILTILAQVANLAELTQFACITLRRVTGTSRAALYAVRCGSAEIMFEGVATAAADRRADAQPDERDLLRRIQAVMIESITVTAPIPA